MTPRRPSLLKGLLECTHEQQSLAVLGAAAGLCVPDPSPAPASLLLKMDGRPWLLPPGALSSPAAPEGCARSCRGCRASCSQPFFPGEQATDPGPCTFPADGYWARDPTKKGWEIWGCSAWGGEGCGETSEQLPGPGGAARELERGWDKGRG